MNKPSDSSETARSLVATGQWFRRLVLLLIFGAISAVQAQVPTACETELRAAEQQFLDGKFDSASSLIRFCLKKKEATTQDSVKAYILLGKIYIARDSTTQARETFKTALKLSNCQMTLDANQETPEVMRLFKEVKKQTCGKSKIWIWVGVGVAVAGTTVAIICSRPEPPPLVQDGFVEPPGRPTGK